MGSPIKLRRHMALGFENGVPEKTTWRHELDHPVVWSLPLTISEDFDINNPYWSRQFSLRCIARANPKSSPANTLSDGVEAMDVDVGENNGENGSDDSDDSDDNVVCLPWHKQSKPSIREHRHSLSNAHNSGSATDDIPTWTTSGRLRYDMELPLVLGCLT